MNKREFERIPANIEVRFHCNSVDYSGNILNISKNGMFISTKEMCSPFNSQFEIFIPHKGSLINVFVNMSRIILSPNSDDGIGVKLSEPSEEYSELVSNLKSVF